MKLEIESREVDSLHISVARTLFATLVLVVSAPFSARATDWNETFGTDAVESYLEEPGARFIVIPAGSNEEAEAAAGAFAAALREGSAELVMDDSSVGDVRSLDDSVIVEKASSLPVDRVAVVRTFPAGEEEPPRVVVAVYRPDGTNVVGITGRGGQSLDRKEGGEPSEGVTREASETVSETAGDVAEDRQKAREEFLEKFLWFEEQIYMDESSRVVGRASVPYRGKYKEKLSFVEFYRAAGKEGMADQYKRRKTTSTVLATTGTLGFLAGTSVFVAGWLSSGTGPAFWGGLAGGGASLITYTVGVNLKVHPATPAERRKMADEHNEHLKEDLGLSTGYEPGRDAIESNSRVPREPLNLHFGLFRGRGGAGARLQFRF